MCNYLDDQQALKKIGGLGIKFFHAKKLHLSRVLCNNIIIYIHTDLHTFNLFLEKGYRFHFLLASLSHLTWTRLEENKNEVYVNKEVGFVSGRKQRKIMTQSIRYCFIELKQFQELDFVHPKFPTLINFATFPNHFTASFQQNLCNSPPSKTPPRSHHGPTS